MKSQFQKAIIEKQKHKNPELIKLYELTLELANNESKIVWGFSNAFIITDSIIIGFIAQVLTKNNSVNILQKNNIALTLSVIGIFINILWFFSFRRRWSWYNFRMFQVRQREPENWNLIDGDGKYFSDGDNIEGYKIPYFSQIINTQTIFYILIFLFMLVFIVIIIINLPFKG